MAADGVETRCMSCADQSCDFKPSKMKRRLTGARDVQLEVHYCGVCHSDVLAARNEMDFIMGEKVKFPCVPGHEIAGVVTEVGPEVTKFAVGDHIGVGWFVDTCRTCKSCKSGNENFCSKMTTTVAGKPSERATMPPNESGQLAGGFSNLFTVDERYAVKVPKSYPLEYAGPIMCGGITVFTPLKKYGVKAGTTVGIVGVGGLGVMGIKLAKALGAKVTAISRGTSKEEFARKCGAESYVATSSEESMKAAAGTLDLIINTVPRNHSAFTYEPLLKPKGMQVLVGPHEEMFASIMTMMMWGSRSNVGGSAVGTIAALQDLIDLADKEDIKSEIELVSVTELNKIFGQLSNSNDSGLRYVLKIKETLTPALESSYSAEPPKLGPPADKFSYPTVLKRVAVHNAHQVKRLIVG